MHINKKKLVDLYRTVRTASYPGMHACMMHSIFTRIGHFWAGFKKAAQFNACRGWAYGLFALGTIELMATEHFLLHKLALQSCIIYYTYTVSLYSFA
jgi:hypothetical protein